MSIIEKQLEQEYDELWSNPKKIKRDDENLALGWHFGFYEKGARTYKRAVINMNDYVDRLLGIQHQTVRVLDAGCGIGATVIHLAQRHPRSTFYGITLSAHEITNANQLQRKNNLQNTFFSQQSYNTTAFPDNFFDIVYLLESFWYAESDTLFLKEMKRLLKHHGKLVIVDAFCRNDCSSRLMKNINRKILQDSDYDKPQRTIDTFERSLSQEGFNDIKIKDIKKNIRHLYSFILIRLFHSLRIELRTNMKAHRRGILSSIKDFLVHFIFYTILFIHLDIGYYAITAQKT